MTVTDKIEARASEAGADVFLHAVPLEGDGEIAVSADESVVLASIFKVAVLVEVTAQAVGGAFSFTDRVTVHTADRVVGPTGLSVMRDDVELSLRDLAFLMMSVSDNTAADVLIRMVGLDAVNKRLRDLGLAHTELVDDCRGLLGDLAHDLGIGDGEPLDTSSLTSEQVSQCRVLRPDETSRSTARETTALLRAIWRDEAAPADACAEARRIMRLQVWPHRLRSGFPSNVIVGAKTGTLVVWRNEAGVVTFPDGAAYAVAVFTRARRADSQQPAVDRLIGQAAALAVDALRDR